MKASSLEMKKWLEKHNEEMELRAMRNKPALERAEFGREYMSPKKMPKPSPKKKN